MSVELQILALAHSLGFSFPTMEIELLCVLNRVWTGPLHFTFNSHQLDKWEALVSLGTRGQART